MVVCFIFLRILYGERGGTATAQPSYQIQLPCTLYSRLIKLYNLPSLVYFD